jgi:hypothetical protein
MRLAGYDRNGDEISEADVLSDDELAADYALIRLQRGAGRRGFRRPRKATTPPMSRETAEQVDRFWPEREREQER